MRHKYLKFLLIFILFFIWVQIVEADVLGQKVFFKTDKDYSAAGVAQTQATLQYISQYAYFYTEDDWWNKLPSLEKDLGAIQKLATEFDRVIYPILRGTFGSEWKPGIDNDERITIFLLRMKEGVGGYFSSEDGYPQSAAPNSNEREMIYLNAFYYNDPREKNFLTHEFQHLISFYQKDKLNNISDEIWLNEARSEYAPTLVGYDDYFLGSNLEKRISDFLINPSNSLTEWRNEKEDYGSVNLFMQYLIEHYGLSILNNMMITPKIGIESIDSALARLGFQNTFADVFTDWVITLFLNDCSRGVNQRYCYLNKNLQSDKLRILPTSTYTFPSSGVNAIMSASLIKDWTPYWYKFTGGHNNLKITFEGNNEAKFVVPYILIEANGQKEVKFLNLNGQQKGIIYIPNFGTEIESVILIPTSQTKLSGFNNQEPFYSFSYSATTVLKIPEDNVQLAQTDLVEPNYPDGSLIRAQGDYKVYIIKGKYKRWIQTGEIFNFYGHLNWNSIIEVTSQERDWYEDAWLVRADGDYKVYEINSDGTKHWLNMTAEWFAQSGRKWDMVFIINKTERDWYRAGANVLR